MHTNLLLIQLLVWTLHSTTTVICSRKNMNEEPVPMSHDEQEILVAVEEGLPFVISKRQ